MREEIGSLSKMIDLQKLSVAQVEIDLGEVQRELASRQSQSEALFELQDRRYASNNSHISPALIQARQASIAREIPALKTRLAGLQSRLLQEQKRMEILVEKLKMKKAHIERAALQEQIEETIAQKITAKLSVKDADDTSFTKG